MPDIDRNKIPVTTTLAQKKVTRVPLSMIGERVPTGDHIIYKDGALQALPYTTASGSLTIVSGSADPETGILTLKRKDGSTLTIDGFLSFVNLENGIVGPTGEQGRDGKNGLDGRDGLPGLPGCVGTKGDIGILGNVGQVGAKGQQGPKGNSGDIGPSGPRGPQGEQGYKGEQGVIGNPGPPGPPGPIGDHGLSIAAVKCCDGKLYFLMSDGTEHHVTLPKKDHCPTHLCYNDQDFSKSPLITYGYIIDEATDATILNILQQRLYDDTGIWFTLQVIGIVYDQYALPVSQGGLGRPADYEGLRGWCKRLSLGELDSASLKTEFLKLDEFKSAQTLKQDKRVLLPAAECLKGNGSFGGGSNHWPDVFGGNNNGGTGGGTGGSGGGTGGGITTTSAPSPSTTSSGVTTTASARTLKPGPYRLKIVWQQKSPYWTNRSCQNNAPGMMYTDQSPSSYGMGSTSSSAIITANSPIIKFSWYCSGNQMIKLPLGSTGCGWQHTIISNWDWMIYPDGCMYAKPILLSIKSNSSAKGDSTSWSVNCTNMLLDCQYKDVPTQSPSAYFLPEQYKGTW